MLTNRLYNEDCLEVLKRLEDNSIDAIVTDPPFGLGFMGKEWDTFDKSQGLYDFTFNWATECLRVIKPGGNLLSFGGTRTYHRMVCAIENAGWQIRDTIMWVYGSGFPKSLDISKAIDKGNGRLNYFDKFRQMLKSHIEEHKITQQSIINHFDSEVVWHWFGNSQPQIPSREKWADLKEFIGITNPDFDKVYEKVEREIIGEREDFVKRRCKKEPDSIWNTGKNFGSLEFSQKQGIITTPATPEAKLWEGYGTGLKPAYEPIVLAMKPLDGTFAENCLRWGVGGLNIDGCRIEYKEQDLEERTRRSGVNCLGKEYNSANEEFSLGKATIIPPHFKGRFPANFIHDGSQEVMELFPDSKSAGKYNDTNRVYVETAIFNSKLKVPPSNKYAGDSGSAARFFYCAKASRRERDDGLDGLPLSEIYPQNNSIERKELNATANKRARNNHPTVKPLALMEYLVKLVTRLGHIVLDPFLGSGTTAMACKKLGRYYIGCEIDRNYYVICQKRIEAGIC